MSVWCDKCEYLICLKSYILSLSVNRLILFEIINMWEENLLRSLLKSSYQNMNAFISLFFWGLKLLLFILFFLDFLSFSGIGWWITFFLTIILFLPWRRSRRWRRNFLFLFLFNCRKLVPFFNKLNYSLNNWGLFLHIQNIGSANLSENIKWQLYKSVNATALILIFKYIIKIIYQNFFTCLN